MRLIEEKATSGVALTVLGFGMDRERDSTLEQLAATGHGNHGYVHSRRDAEKMLAEQVGATLLTAAKDVKVQVEFNPTLVESYRLIGYEDRLLQPQDFGSDASGGMTMGQGQSVTAVYEVVPKPAAASPAAGAKPATLLTCRVRYREPAANTARMIEIPLSNGSASFDGASADFKFAAAVAEFGMILRDSPHRGTASIGDVVNWAVSAMGKPADDRYGYRAEFIDLVRRTETLLR
jgi:Ca-activated chloride channel family protein